MAVGLGDKIDHARHTWGAPAMILGAMIQREDPGGAMGEPLADGLPPWGEASPQAVPGHCRGPTVQKPFVPRREEKAHGSDRRCRSNIVLGRSAMRAALPATGQRAHLDGRLRVA